MLRTDAGRSVIELLPNGKTSDGRSWDFVDDIITIGDVSLMRRGELFSDGIRGMLHRVAEDKPLGHTEGRKRITRIAAGGKSRAWSPSGPGTQLKRRLARCGIVATKGCKCEPRSEEMDRNGPDWCEANIDTIVEWMREEATNRRLPFVEFVARRIANKAIAKARKKFEPAVADLMERLKEPTQLWPAKWEHLPEVHEAHRRLIDETVSNPPEYPLGTFSGRGIITIAGGKYFTGGYVLCRMLRDQGCLLPIEVWHLGAGEFDAEMGRLLRDLGGIEIIDASERLAGKPRMFGGWHSKVWAILESRFAEVLYLDADQIPIRDPSFLFDDLRYRETGAVLWPDLHNRPGMDITEQAFRTAGLPVPGRSRDPGHNKPTDYDPIESGQLLFDKQKAWKALQLVKHLNDHSDYWYRQPQGRHHWHIYGDKSTFYLGFERAGKYALAPPCHFVGHGKGGAFVQHDLDGEPLFQHRCQPTGKLQVFGKTWHPPGFVGGDKVDQILSELRRKWSRVFHGPISDQVPQDVLDAIPGAYEWFRGDRRDSITLLPDGLVHQMDWTWSVQNHEGKYYLSLVDAAGKAYTHGQDNLYSWCQHERQWFLTPAPPADWKMVRAREELGIWCDLVLRNEYRLPDRMDGMTVVDVGAHVGTFARCCLERGAARVICLEPCSDNFAMLSENLRAYGHNATLIRAAAWTHSNGISLTRPGGAEHTGGAAAFADGQWPVPSVDINGVLALASQVDLLKLDCEGAEWPILWHADLSRVKAIAGEWHTRWLAELETLTGERYSLEALRERLERAGMQVTIEPNPGAPETLGWLFAHVTPRPNIIHERLA